MNRQEELMKDWSLERQVTALNIVSSNFCLFKKYSAEQLLTLALCNRDAFDLFAAILADKKKKQGMITPRQAHIYRVWADQRRRQWAYKYVHSFRRKP